MRSTAYCDLPKKIFYFNMRSTGKRGFKIIKNILVIHSDEWPAYASLGRRGFAHSTVNHQRNYVDPGSGAHTQAVERSWLDAKIKILKKNERRA